jgi:transposase-like protein
LYNIDRKRRLVAEQLRAGGRPTQICQELGVSRGLVLKVQKLLAAGQDVAPQPRGGNRQQQRTDAAGVVPAAVAAIADNRPLVKDELGKEESC